MPRSRLVFALLLPLAFFACDKGGDKKAGDKKADDKKADEKKAEAPQPEADAPKKLEQPWKLSEVSKAMTPGTTLVYHQTGTDGKGKDVEDDYRCVIKTATTSDVGTVCNGVEHPSEDKGANETATAGWTQYSPFFAVADPVEVELVERADLSVPAGTFDTVKAELSGFFGNSYTVWMIVDQPGVYAKVHKHANKAAEDDKTDMIFELSSK
jgi:hypothetical protein